MNEKLLLDDDGRCTMPENWFYLQKERLSKETNQNELLANEIRGWIGRVVHELKLGGVSKAHPENTFSEMCQILRDQLKEYVHFMLFRQIQNGKKRKYRLLESV